MFKTKIHSKKKRIKKKIRNKIHKELNKNNKIIKIFKIKLQMFKFQIKKIMQKIDHLMLYYKMDARIINQIKKNRNNRPRRKNQKSNPN